MTAVSQAGDFTVFSSSCNTNVFPQSNTQFSTQAITINDPHTYPEVVEVPGFGECDACEDCEFALSCMSGAFEYMAVAQTREEQREGKALPCVDEGLVRLKVLTTEEAAFIPVMLPVAGLQPDGSWVSPNITLEPADGTFVPGEEITGSSSGASGTITVTTTDGSGDLLVYPTITSGPVILDGS